MIIQNNKTFLIIIIKNDWKNNLTKIILNKIIKTKNKKIILNKKLRENKEKYNLTKEHNHLMWLKFSFQKVKETKSNSNYIWKYQ